METCGIIIINLGFLLSPRFLPGSWCLLGDDIGISINLGPGVSLGMTSEISINQACFEVVQGSRHNCDARALCSEVSSFVVL